MGLYLCIFDQDEDVNGVEVGSYADYNALRDFVVRELEAERAGSRFPTFILHPDSEGEWTCSECEKVLAEIAEIASALKERPAIKFNSGWQKVVAGSIGLEPQNAFQSFIDVDGEFLLERLQDLLSHALRRRLPVLFQ